MKTADARLVQLQDQRERTLALVDQQWSRAMRTLRSLDKLRRLIVRIDRRIDRREAEIADERAARRAARNGEGVTDGFE